MPHFCSIGDEKDMSLRVPLTSVLAIAGFSIVLAIVLVQETSASAFPGTNGKIAFCTAGGIVVMNADGSDQTLLADTAPVYGCVPDWSPDGSKIVFQGVVNAGGNSVSQLFVINADGTGLTQLTTFGTANDGPYAPKWSPEGSQIVFHTENGEQIYVMNADGSGITQLTHANSDTDPDGLGYRDPNWSPDGRWIVFQRIYNTLDGLRCDLWTMNPTGGERRQLTAGAGGPGFCYPDEFPTWSPDGTKIAFTRGGGGIFEIYVVDADGSGLTQLTNNGVDFEPSWSPDGTMIAFSEYFSGSGKYDIVAMNADGSGQTNLTNSGTSSRNEFPSWQPIPSTPNQAPTITSANATTFTVGSAGTFTVTTSGTPTVATINETGALPTGVSFNDNADGTATVSGTPGGGTGGMYPLTITAANGVLPNATQSFTLTVNQAPAITSANAATFAVGSAGTFTVTTSGFPTAATITTTGALPAGVSFTNNGGGTATLSGTPASGTGGSYPLTITAANGVLPNATQSFTLAVCAADITASVSVSQGALKLNRKTGHYTQRITLKNGDGAVSGPVSLVLDTLSSNATLFNATGTTACAPPLGSPYVNVDVGVDNVFSPRERVSVALEFVNPSGQGVTYTSRVLAGSGTR
jgi:Tol biopolymer transport system component